MKIVMPMRKVPVECLKIKNPGDPVSIDRGALLASQYSLVCKTDEQGIPYKIIFGK